MASLLVQISVITDNRHHPNFLQKTRAIVLSSFLDFNFTTFRLDPYVGFMHTDRPGRVSLALDMIEELRPVLADRFVLTLINKKMVTGKDFIKKEDGAVLISDKARKNLLTEWQNKKKDMITHPYLDEKVEWGMIPYIQAMLLARYLRRDLDEYPPFFWK